MLQMTHAFGPPKSSDQRIGSEYSGYYYRPDCDSLSGYPIVSIDPKNYLFDGPLFGAGKPCVLRPVFGLVAWVGNRDNLSRRRARVRPAWSGPHEQSAAQPRINRARCTRRSRGDLAPNSRRPLRYRLTCRLTCRFSLARDE